MYRRFWRERWVYLPSRLGVFATRCIFFTCHFYFHLHLHHIHIHLHLSIICIDWASTIDSNVRHHSIDNTVLSSSGCLVAIGEEGSHYINICTVSNFVSGELQYYHIMKSSPNNVSWHFVNLVIIACTMLYDNIMQIAQHIYPT